MPDVEPVLARKMHRTLEPYHGVVYFSPETAERYRALGLPDRQMGYFASRSAPMGPVSGEVVVATFFNFAPAEVLRCIPAAWAIAAPEAMIEARLAGIDATLRRLLGDVVDSDEVAEAAGLARRATEACRPEGRPLYAGHASLAWPDRPHLELWHALSLLREHRGDGHIAALVVEGVDGCEALVIHAATGEVPASVLQASRSRTDDEWAAAQARLRDRGWLDDTGGLTDAGRSHRQWVEDRTDQLALAPWAHLGQEGSDRLRQLVRPWSKAIVASGTFGFRPD